ncbi:MAG: flagellin [Beijerinckiaceae bacterium]
MSSSILTNNSAMTALLALDQTQQTMDKYENQISTGLAISGAADNASYWSIATSMSSDNGALGAVSAALSESSAFLSTTSAALQSTISVMDSIKNDLTEASNPGANMADIQTDIAAQQQLLFSIGSSATFNGLNLLTNSQAVSGAAPTTLGAGVNLAASYNSSGGTQAVSYISIATQYSGAAVPGTELFDGTTGATNAATATGGILGTAGTNSGVSVLQIDITGDTPGSTTIANLLADVQTAIGSITTAASTIGGAQTNVTDQQSFISNLSVSLTDGVGSLVDADMNQASTKIAALQVQQQLGVQALSIANSNTQLILKLFGQ